jgi:hypothetical protein
MCMWRVTFLMLYLTCKEKGKPAFYPLFNEVPMLKCYNSFFVCMQTTFGDRGVSRGQRDGSPWPLISIFYTEAATFHSSSSSVILTKLSGRRFRYTHSLSPWPLVHERNMPTELSGTLLLRKSGSGRTGTRIHSS